MRYLNKTLKFTPKLAQLIIEGKKTTTWRFYYEKDLKVGDEITLATRDGNKVGNFGRARVLEITHRTIETLTKEDYFDHEPVDDVLTTYRGYYDRNINEDTPMLVIKFEVIEIF